MSPHIDPTDPPEVARGKAIETLLEVCDEGEAELLAFATNRETPEMPLHFVRALCASALSVRAYLRAAEEGARG